MASGKFIMLAAFCSRLNIATSAANHSIVLPMIAVLDEFSAIIAFSVIGAVLSRVKSQFYCGKSFNLVCYLTKFYYKFRY